MMYFWLLFGIGVYLLPAIWAGINKHPRIEGIALLNLFFGWTIVGWFGALIWAACPPIKAKP